MKSSRDNDRFCSRQFRKIFRVDRINAANVADGFDNVLRRDKTVFDVRDRPFADVPRPVQKVFDQSQILRFRFDICAESSGSRFFQIVPEIIAAAHPFVAPRQPAERGFELLIMRSRKTQKK